MLEKINLSKKLNKAEYKQLIDPLEIKLGALQRAAKDKNVPVIIVFEGWGAAGKGTMINKLILSLDPRGYVVHTTIAPNEEERLRPFLWRFWQRLPERGRMAIFDRSWYRRVLVGRVDKTVKKRDWQAGYGQIKSFERQLTDDGAVIIKFFLHISKKEQKKRFERLEHDSATAWRVTKADWRHNKQYPAYVSAIEEMLAKTDSDFAPWTIVEAHDRRFATVKIFQRVVDMIETKLAAIDAEAKAAKTAKARHTKAPGGRPVYLEKLGSSILEEADLSLSLGRAEYERALKKYQQRIGELQQRAYMHRLPVVIVYSGWDAAGKGGNIKRLVQGMDPRGYQVIPIAAPNDIEKAHHYLWRFWTKMPKAGHVAIFDRSWYGRVMVERVEGFCSEEEWKRAYQEINEMEEQWVQFGCVLVKLWIHIDQKEQLKRFKQRQVDPHKNWKITEEDWRNRKKWNLYKQAVDEMLYRTSTNYAPWTIVESNCKWYARIKALKKVTSEIERKLPNKD
jgi:polyphosphate kinase 2 (PPK2 family)